MSGCVVCIGLLLDVCYCLSHVFLKPHFVILSKRSAAKDPYTNEYTIRVFVSNKSESIYNK